MAHDRRRTSPDSTVALAMVRQFARAMPGAEEGASHDPLAFRVRGKLFVWLHESGDSVAIKIDDKDRMKRVEADPETFYITDHYLRYPIMLVRLATVDADDLRELVEESWRRCAPKRLIAAFDNDIGV